MPHLSIEYSSNLDDRCDMQALCDALHVAMMESGLFEPGAIRVRAFASKTYTIADRLAENAFADLCLRIGEGRSMAERKALGDTLLAVAETHFASELARPHFALSLDIAEIDRRYSWKRNAIHPRLRGISPKKGNDV